MAGLTRTISRSTVRPPRPESNTRMVWLAGITGSLVQSGYHRVFLGATRDNPGSSGRPRGQTGTDILESLQSGPLESLQSARVFLPGEGAADNSISSFA